MLGRFANPAKQVCALGVGFGLGALADKLLKQRETGQPITKIQRKEIKTKIDLTRNCELSPQYMQKREWLESQLAQEELHDDTTNDSEQIAQLFIEIEKLREELNQQTITTKDNNKIISKQIDELKKRLENLLTLPTENEEIKNMLNALIEKIKKNIGLEAGQTITKLMNAMDKKIDEQGMLLKNALSDELNQLNKSINEKVAALEKNKIMEEKVEKLKTDYDSLLKLIDQKVQSETFDKYKEEITADQQETTKVLTNRIDALERNKADVDGRVDMLKKNKIDMDEKVAALEINKANMGEFNEEKQRTALEIKRLDGIIQELSSKLAAHTEGLSRDAIESIKEELKKIEVLDTKLEQVVNTYIERLGNTESNITEIKADQQRLREAIEAAVKNAVSDIAELKKYRDDSNNQIQRLVAQVTELETLRHRVGKLESDYTTMNATYDTLKGQIQTPEQLIKLIRDTVGLEGDKKLNKILDELIQNNVDTKISDLMSKYNELNALVKEKAGKKEIAQLKAEITKMEGDLFKLITDNGKRIRALETQLQTLPKTILDQASVLLAQIKQDHQNLVANIETDRNAFNVFRAQYETDKQDMQTAGIEIKNLYDTLQKEYVKTANAVINIKDYVTDFRTTELPALITRVDELSRLIGEFNTKITSTEGQLTNLENSTRLADLENKVNNFISTVPTNDRYNELRTRLEFLEKKMEEFLGMSKTKDINKLVDDVDAIKSILRMLVTRQVQTGLY